MIGWENNQGAYFIDKLQSQINSLTSEDETIETSIGTMSNLTTTEKTNLVGAVNEVNSSVGTTDAKIGTLSNLNTSDKTDIVASINSVYALLGGAKIINFGAVGGGKKLVLTNTGNDHIELLLLAHGTSADVHYAGLATLSGTSTQSLITPLGTAGAKMSATGSGKTITLTNSGSVNARCYAIIFDHGSNVSYTIENVE